MEKKNFESEDKEDKVITISYFTKIKFKKVRNFFSEIASKKITQDLTLHLLLKIFSLIFHDNIEDKEILKEKIIIEIKSKQLEE